MRTAGIEAFNYKSARDRNKGINIGLFSPKAFAAKKPKENSLQTWQCITSDTSVEFIHASSLTKSVISFSVEEFIFNELSG